MTIAAAAIVAAPTGSVGMFPNTSRMGARPSTVKGFYSLFYEWSVANSPGMFLAVLAQLFKFKAQFTNITMQQGRTAYVVAFRKQLLPPSAWLRRVVSPARAEGNM